MSACAAWWWHHAARVVGMVLLIQCLLEKEICCVAQASFKLLAILLPHLLSSGMTGACHYIQLVQRSPPQSI